MAMTLTGPALADENRVELRVYDEETDRFVVRAYRDSFRAWQLLTQSRNLRGAEQTLAGFHREAGRRVRQRQLDPSDPKWDDAA